jgi:hypothetical protein
MGRSLASGDLAKTQQMGGVAAQVALYAVAGVCLDQRRWSHSSKEAQAAGGAKAASSEAMAVNVLRGVVRCGDQEVLQGLVGAAEQLGVPAEEARRALAVACYGDPVLMSVLDRCLQLR